MNRVSLNIIYENRVLSIPFKDLKSLDMFTINYNSYIELFNVLNKILDLKLDVNKFKDVYISYSYKRRNGKMATCELPIRLSMDDYDIDDLKKVYADYYKDNHMRILATRDGIRHVKHDAIRTFNARSRDVTDSDIDSAVNSYFDGSYKKYRDAYFTVVKSGYTVKNNEYFDKDNRTDLSKYQTDNEYFNYLRRYANTSDEGHDKAIEILSGYDVDELKRNGMNGLFDNEEISKKEDDLEIDTLSIEALSGKSLEELRDLIISYRDNYNNGRKR